MTQQLFFLNAGEEISSPSSSVGSRCPSLPWLVFPASLLQWRTPHILRGTSLVSGSLYFPNSFECSPQALFRFLTRSTGLTFQGQQKTLAGESQLLLFLNFL